MIRDVFGIDRGRSRRALASVFVIAAMAWVGRANAQTPTPDATPAPESIATPETTPAPVATATATPASTPEPAPTPTPDVIAPAAIGTTEDLGDLSLEALLEIPIAAALRIPRPVRESPAVLTLVTADRIAAMGARDLVDVLQMVPGFFFGVDLKGVVGVGFRGNWAHEGKVLVMIDGQELNELLYYNTPFGNHLPVDQIERIEIVRGPGSVLYGASAELGVVNIVTKGAPDAAGHVVEAGGRYGQSGEALMRRNAHLRYGRRFKGGTAVSLAGFIGDGARGSKTYTDLYGDELNMSGESRLETAYLNGSISHGGFQARLIRDWYRIHSRDGYEAIFPETVLNDFGYWLGDAKWDVKIGEKVKITPRVIYRRNSTWRSLPPDTDIASYFDPVTSRSTAELTASVEAMSGLSALAGIAYALDEYWLITDEGVGRVQEDPEDRIFGGPGKLTYGNASAFAQVLWDTKVVDLSAGARVESHSKYGDSFVPRLAATRVFGAFHAKAMFSQAFRAPSIDNIDYNPDIAPERVTALEAEVGYRFGEWLFATVNVFDLTIDETIVYAVDPDSGVDNYYNFGRSGTQGAEMELQSRIGHAELFGGYAFHTAEGKNEVSAYAVEGHDEVMLGASQHKVSGGGRIRLPRGIYAGATAVWHSERYGYAGDGEGGGVLTRFRPLTMANVYAGWYDPATRLDVSAGLYNVFDEPYTFIQPYDGAHPPLPGDPRELSVRVSIGF